MNTSTYTCSSSEINRSKSDTRRNSTWSPSTPKLPLGRTGWRTYLSWVWRGLGSGSRVCRAGAPLIPTPPCSTLCLTQGPRLSIYWLMADQTRWAGHTVIFDITYNLFGILIFCDDKKKKSLWWHGTYTLRYQCGWKYRIFFKKHNRYSKILDCTISDQKKIQYF